MTQLADHLWLHVTRTAGWRGAQPRVPVLDRGEGCYVRDADGKRYLDGPSHLFFVNSGSRRWRPHSSWRGSTLGVTGLAAMGICDRYGVLLVSDEVICAFGRLGWWTGAERYGYLPDLLTFAKGVTSGYAPLAGVAETLSQGPAVMFSHGATWGGHPVACAVALANLGVLKSEDVLGAVRRNEAWLEGELRELGARHRIVGDVRGAGYFWALELIADRDAKVLFTADQADDLLRGFLVPRLLEFGMIARADSRDQPILQIAPPLVADRGVLGELIDLLDQILAEAGKRMGVAA